MEISNKMDKTVIPTYQDKCTYMIQILQDLFCSISNTSVVSSAVVTAFVFFTSVFSVIRAVLILFV